MSKPASLADAYTRARFEILLPAQTLIRRIDVIDPAADTALQTAGCRTHWHVLTPCNPLSERLSDDENARRIAACASQLDAQAWRYVPALNRADDGDWPEPGFAIFDADEATVCALGRGYRQHAIVGGRLGAAPELIWLFLPA